MICWWTCDKWHAVISVPFQNAGDLEDQYPDVLKRLNDKYNSTADAKDRVEKLRIRANTLATETTQKFRKLESKNSISVLLT